VRSIWSYHTYDNDWGDIGYNYLIDPNGVVYEGRAGGDNVIGAHFSCQNGGTMGVCVLGTYTSVSPTTAALSSLKQLLAWKAEQRSIDPLGSSYHSGTHLTLANICAHRDANPANPIYSCTPKSTTTCPGDNLYGLLPGIRTDVYKLINGGTVSVPTVSTQPATLIIANSARIWGHIGNDGGSAISDRHFDWGTSSGNLNQWTAAVTVSGNDFYYNVPALTPNTTYYFRAWAKNGSGQIGPCTPTPGWGCGNILSFTTTATPTVEAPTISPSGGSYANPVQVSLACGTYQALIYYTTDGSNPTTSSLSYEGPFTLTSSATVKAKAFKSGYNDSALAQASFTITVTPTVAQPTISPSGGIYADSVQVSLACTTSGATIRYTTDGSSPTASSTAYSGPFTLTSSATVKAKAFKSGYNDSVAASAGFTITVTPTVVAPTISPNGGSYANSVQVTLACATYQALIYYTIDGSNPTTSSLSYEGPFTLTSSATVKAKAFKSGYNDSAIASAGFSITVTPTVAQPTISPNGGSYADSVQVTLACATSGATIRYTTDGSNPTASSTAYSGSLTLTSSATVKAKAFKSGYNDSAIASAGFTITVTPTVVAPTISPNGGSYADSVQVSLACATSGATIRYTTDGSGPTASSTAYSGPFTLTSSATVKAKAFKTGYNDSPTAQASFSVQGAITATHSSPSYTSPGTCVVNVEVNHPSGNSLLSLLCRPSLPSGWTLAIVSGDGSPEIQAGEIVFIGSLMGNPVRFSYAANVPSGLTTSQSIRTSLEYQLTGMANPATIYAAPDPTVPSTSQMQFNLSAGYNLVSIPFSGTALTNAEALAVSIANCSGVWQWDATSQGWSGHPKGGPNNFPLAPGRVCLVSVTAPSTFQMTGRWAAFTQSLKRGYNLISVTEAQKVAVTNAEALAIGVPNCSGVWKWDAATQGWSGHPKGGPNNFAVEVGRAYLVSVTADGNW
jgi:hypothetical protein